MQKKFILQSGASLELQPTLVPSRVRFPDAHFIMTAKKDGRCKKIGKTSTFTT